jgi:uncharacterized spore protein YtfJ
MATNNNVVDILQAVVGNLKEMAKSENIVGKPIQAGDKMILPIMTISVGFGAGGGQGEMAEKSGFGGGGGGGLKIEPAAFLIVDKDGASILPAKHGTWEGIINAIPGVIEKATKLRDSMKANKEEAK